MRIIDGSGKAPYAGEVLVSGNRIVAVAGDGSALARDGADEFRRTAREMCREGVDTLKINPSGDEFVPFARADLLLVDGGPAKDIALLQDATRFSAIMKDGNFHKAPTSATRFDEAAAE